jgi:hypothetical protein
VIPENSPYFIQGLRTYLLTMCQPLHRLMEGLSIVVLIPIYLPVCPHLSYN